MRLEFHPEAELELIEAAVHYELQVPGLGRRLEAEIRRATDLLLQHPEIGPLVDPNLRKFVLGRFELETQLRTYELDLRKVDRTSLSIMRKVLKKMNYDGRVQMFGV
jgi:plasmid stabilization system protein ParE